MGEVRIGISGWRYPRWRGTFYPAGLPQRRELEYASTHLSTVELNGSFYSLQRPSSYRAWAESTPPGFLFAVKGGRFVTHMKRLVDVETPLANFFASGVLALGERLGPLLWQLPPTLRFDPGVLGAFLDLLPRSTEAAARLSRRHDDRLRHGTWTETDADRPLRHALEVRHQSFVTPAVGELLRHHGVALVVADSAGRWPALDEATSDLRYVRLHGDTELYTSGYGEEALERWEQRIRAWHADGADVVVYFDNDAKVHAPFDAMSLRARLADIAVPPLEVIDPPPGPPAR